MAFYWNKDLKETLAYLKNQNTMILIPFFLLFKIDSSLLRYIPTYFPSLQTS